MIISKPDIQELLESGLLVIDPPPVPASIDQVSIDLHLGRKFTKFMAPPEHIPMIRVRRSVMEDQDLWEHMTRDTYVLNPGELVLASTLERLKMPPDHMGLIEGRSIWARLGIGVHMTAPKIDPGFDGTVTLEITNQGKTPVQLVAETDAPCQLIIARVSTELKEGDLYGGPDDAFQYQTSPIPRSG